MAVEKYQCCFIRSLLVVRPSSLYSHSHIDICTFARPLFNFKLNSLHHHFLYVPYRIGCSVFLFIFIYQVTTSSIILILGVATYAMRWWQEKGALDIIHAINCTIHTHTSCCCFIAIWGMCDVLFNRFLT